MTRIISNRTELVSFLKNGHPRLVRTTSQAQTFTAAQLAQVRQLIE
jgi:hypothetical protein